jgi:hypothetical protein
MVKSMAPPALAFATSSQRIGPRIASRAATFRDFFLKQWLPYVLQRDFFLYFFLFLFLFLFLFFTQWLPYATQQDLLHAHRRRACHAVLPGTPLKPQILN